MDAVPTVGANGSGPKKLLRRQDAIVYLTELRGQPGADGGQWESLVVHQNDKSLSTRTPSAAWAVRSCRPEGYRRFRLFLTGANSHGNHYLMASGVELYGVLLG